MRVRLTFTVDVTKDGYERMREEMDLGEFGVKQALAILDERWQFVVLSEVDA